ncbi:MAG: type II toxin-antitoxin system PemK/MazF family toxin [Lachnospiraceae bacterium]|nr:type II toxin-antitoxin system PemK/MazF family toxin [Lachnospiraceae bacterium]
MKNGWMTQIDQGDLIKVSRARVPFLVVSSSFYNQSGNVIVCPIVKEAKPDPLHIEIISDSMKGIVLCEELATVSVHGRGCTVRGHLSGKMLLEIVYRVQSIFDYVPHGN